MYNSNEVSKRIKELAKEHKVTVKQVLSDAGLSNNFMAGLNKSMPKADNLAKIADELNCSIDYLMSRSDSPDSNKKSALELAANPETLEFMKLFEQLDDDKRSLILNTMKGFLEK